jgi:hypothetical protein
MSVSRDLYSVPSFEPEDPLYIEDGDREVKGYGPEWYSLHRFMVKLSLIVGLPRRKILSAYGYFYHRVHGNGSIGLNVRRPTESNDDELYHMLHLFQGVGFFIVLGWKTINYRVQRCKHLTLWQIIDNSITMNHFLDLLSLIWNRSRAQSGIVVPLDSTSATLNSKWSSKAEYTWFGDQMPSILAMPDRVLDTPEVQSRERVIPAIIMAARDPTEEDLEYMRQESYEQVRTWKFNDRKKLIMNWIVEACVLNVRFQAPYTLAWPFPPTRYKDDTFVDKDLGGEGPSDDDIKRIIQQRNLNLSLFLSPAPETPSLPPPLLKTSTDDKKTGQALDSKGAFIATPTIAILPPKHRRDEESDEEEEDEKETEDQQQPPRKKQAKESSITIEQYYATDVTKEMIQIREYEFCLSILAEKAHKEVGEVEMSLLLFQTLTTQVFFVHWVSLFYYRNRILSGKIQPSRIVRKELDELRTAYDEYMDNQSW